MKYMDRTIFYFFLSLFFFYGEFSSPGFATQPGRQYQVSGQTMGTFYTVKFISGHKESENIWKARVDTRLKEVNKHLSMFDPKSELSRFNRAEIKTPVRLSSDFYTIVLTARNLYHLTDGAWDGTVKPLVDLWGFGTKKKTNQIPGPDNIARALSKTGFHHLQIKKNQTVYKMTDVTLDLGSIAKGYGVDAIALLFAEFGIKDVLVEIGGELYASGKNKKGIPWSVGISRPDKKTVNQGLYKIVHLNNQAIATSGNYRNFFEQNHTLFSHIIDPKTGYPVNNRIVSTSVIAKNCTVADGLATALMVMDVQKAIGLVNQLEDTECLIIQKKAGRFINHLSDRFNAFLAK